MISALVNNFVRYIQLQVQGWGHDRREQTTHTWQMRRHNVIENIHSTTQWVECLLRRLAVNHRLSCQSTAQHNLLRSSNITSSAIASERLARGHQRYDTSVHLVVLIDHSEHTYVFTVSDRGQCGQCGVIERQTATAKLCYAHQATVNRAYTASICIAW